MALKFALKFLKPGRGIRTSLLVSVPMSQRGFVTFYQCVPRVITGHRAGGWSLCSGSGPAAVCHPWLWGHQPSKQDHLAVQKVCLSIIPAVSWRCMCGVPRCGCRRGDCRRGSYTGEYSHEDSCVSLRLPGVRSSCCRRCFSRRPQSSGRSGDWFPSFCASVTEGTFPDYHG